MLACLSVEFKEPAAYFEAFTKAITSLNSSLFSQLARRVEEKREKASLSLDGGAAAVLLREHARWLAATFKMQQTEHTHQLHLVILHLFRRIQRILQIACSTTVSHMFMREPATLTCSLTDDNREAGRAPTAMHRAAAWCGAVLAQLRHQPIDHPYEHRGQCEAGSKQRH